MPLDKTTSYSMPLWEKLKREFNIIKNDSGIGFVFKIWKWYFLVRRPNWIFKHINPSVWILIFSRDRLYPPHLISNVDDKKDYIGIGMSFPYKGKMAKVAVRFENNVTGDELKRGIKKLAESVAKPEDPGSGVIFGNGLLSGHEIIIREK